ncbi:PhoH family protein [Mobiluncus curtisii]|uniref:PhoH-like protein n=1 Tax=Mobiluncus curtisii TaxID=2051 RepID=A0A7Y0UHW3_9ACTO|nr:PhoH family protein [Mobiluncus curtisii]MCU9987623.1 PhoH family protein [Mobiluncus curtisii]MCV0000695.1 PhoH family protein [Mobiluncus curtisii]NMW48520.1 PhoH family protein [Mobiluncus curtisii]NMW87615.1 PhoH family protein [Mobiluncus curtisii]NMX13208.1 PhoH family protein [Mobiluncus curtisii]
MVQKRVTVEVPEEIPMIQVLGVNDANLHKWEEEFPMVNFWVAGNEIFIQGPDVDLELAVRTVQTQFTKTNKIKRIIPDYGLQTNQRARLAPALSELPARAADARYRAVFVSREKVIRPQTEGQARYVNDINSHTITFGIGPAGTGKTYLAMARAVKALLEGEVTRLILTRPAVEAGETLGFLPGTLTDKIDPYLRPLYDALREMLDTGTISRMMSDGTIEVAALAYMRGRTLNGSFIILDEAQNTTSEQMKMFLTRLGFGSKMVVTGDITQIDLPSRQPSGLKQVSEILSDVPDIAFSYLSAADVVRHSLVGEIINAYDTYESQTVLRSPQGLGRK